MTPLWYSFRMHQITLRVNPNVSSTVLGKSSRAVNTILPSPNCTQPSQTGLPTNFKLVEDTDLILSKSAVTKASDCEFLISLVRCWSARHSCGWFASLGRYACTNVNSNSAGNAGMISSSDSLASYRLCTSEKSPHKFAECSISVGSGNTSSLL